MRRPVSQFFAKNAKIFAYFAGYLGIGADSADADLSQFGGFFL
jgi:hypothetical protein